MATKLKIPSPAQAKKYFEAKMAFTTGPVELERMAQEGQPVSIVDVRAAEDYAEGHIPGAVNLPKDQWHDNKILKSRLRKDKINVLYCYSHVCHLAATAAVLFASKGFPVMELEGGWRTWKDGGFDVEK
jgi:rhodanese-related sulfurtransferase